MKKALNAVPISQLSLEEFQTFTETHNGHWELDEGIPVKMDSGATRINGCADSLPHSL